MSKRLYSVTFGGTQAERAANRRRLEQGRTQAQTPFVFETEEEPMGEEGEPMNTGEPAPAVRTDGPAFNPTAYGPRDIVGPIQSFSRATPARRKRRKFAGFSRRSFKFLRWLYHHRKRRRFTQAQAENAVRRGRVFLAAWGIAKRNGRRRLTRADVLAAQGGR